MDKELKITKIVANATETSWSQAYNAGKLFAVISLTAQEASGELELNSLGKEVLDNLEAEYFAMEEKNLENIKNAVSSSLSKIPNEVKSSFAAGAISGNILYIFTSNANVVLKRNSNIGNLLSSKESLEGASGFLEDKDVLILETSEFSKIREEESLSLESEDIDRLAEDLAPKVHEKTQGGATALILEFKKIEEPVLAKEDEQETAPILPEEEKRLPTETLQNLFLDLKNKVPAFDRSRKTFLSVAAILVVVFLGSIFFALSKQQSDKNKALLASYYNPALTKYEEGQGLLELNKALARDSFLQSRNLLLSGKDKFEKGSQEAKKVGELLTKVNDALSQTANIKTVSPSPVKTAESELLNSELDSGVQFAAKLDKDIYTLESSGVNKNGKQVIKKDWSEPGGFGVYLGNVYVLDASAKQILKFVSTSNGYVQTNYFKNSPDVSKAKGIAIDGSIWVLLSDGAVLKYTKGESDSLNLSGLDKPFSSPTRIFTNKDLDNIYILDNGNSRIVVFDKTGAYQSQYVSPVLKDAKDFEVGDSKIYFLSNSKLYSFSL